MSKLKPRFIDLDWAEFAAPDRSDGIVRVLAELDSNGIVIREIGYDAKQSLIHRWPGIDRQEYGLFDLAVFDSATNNDLNADEFEHLWTKAIEDEAFWLDRDPQGDRFSQEI